MNFLKHTYVDFMFEYRVSTKLKNEINAQKSILAKEALINVVLGLKYTRIR